MNAFEKPAAVRDSNDPLFSEEYYEKLEELLGKEKADWARLPRAEREHQLSELHRLFNTPDDLALWPPELDGGVNNA